jgi:FkbM family methyltransferase
VKLSALASSIPDSLQIVLADIGSAGGLHRRWDALRNHVTAILFDPLDASTGSERDRYFPVAIAGSKGQARLHVTKRISMASTLPPNTALLRRFWDKPGHTTVIETLEVPTDTLDNVMKANGIVLDAIKIDVQGGEYDILTGARSVFAGSLFLAEVEVSFFERYAGLRTFGDVVALMRESNFDLVDVGRLKRYRYQNSFGIVNPSLGMGDWAGRLAFCDALFMLNDDALLERIAGDDPRGGPDLALKAIFATLAHGKADLAAWIYDASAPRLMPAVRTVLSKYFRGKRRHRLERFGLHRQLDRWARRT